MKDRIKKVIPKEGRRLIRRGINTAHGAAKPVLLRLHSGDTYECPFCGYRAKDLAVIGYDFPVLEERQVAGGGLRRGGCHACGSTDRERLVYLYLTREVGILEHPADLVVLHIAPEERLSGALMDAGLGEYVCGDLFAEEYEYAAHVQKVDVMDIPFADDTFDIVICNHVLEHIADDATAMSEILRVLKPGGQAVLQVPMSLNSPTVEDPSITDPQQRERLFGQWDHVRIYGSDYIERLESVGFRVSTHGMADEYPRYGLNADEVVYAAHK